MYEDDHHQGPTTGQFYQIIQPMSSLLCTGSCPVVYFVQKYYSATNNGLYSTWDIRKSHQDMP